MNKQPFTLDRTVRTVGGILLLAGLLLLTQRLSGVLLPFVAAWLIAYMLNPFVHFFQKHIKIKKNRVGSIIAFFNYYRSCYQHRRFCYIQYHQRDFGDEKPD